jgi:putative phosphoribosyl transferase
MSRPFADRAAAGQVLAERLAATYAGRSDVVVLALPRGGVPVGYEVAKRLRAPLDVFLVRKLGAPGQEELAMGAIASGDVVVINDEVVRALKIAPEVLEAEIEHQSHELGRREAIYRGGRPPLDVGGKIVILIDDGLATGSTMRAAIAALRKERPARIVVAVPIGAASTCAEFERIADECICAVAPENFRAVGLWYEDFAQIGDDEVCTLLGGSAIGAAAPQNQGVAAGKSTKTDGPAAGESHPKAAREPGIEERDVTITTDGRRLRGLLNVPADAPAVVVFVHGSGSCRLSERSRYVASVLEDDGFGTLLIDLLEESEADDQAKVFDIELLAGRLQKATQWLASQPETSKRRLAYFGTSTGTAAALLAAARAPESVGAIVSRGGRPDLARDVLPRVAAPTRLIVGGRDEVVLELNRESFELLECPRLLDIIPRASHLFLEPGALPKVARLASEWFLRYLVSPSSEQ